MSLAKPGKVGQQWRVQGHGAERSGAAAADECDCDDDGIPTIDCLDGDYGFEDSDVFANVFKVVFVMMEVVY